MSDRTSAVLSHGLIIEDAITPPGVYDVRYGVDNGTGALGTLTSPATGDVRRGVQYGGNGDQYTGTMNAPTGGTSWTDDMEDLFDDMSTDDEFRAALIYNGNTVYGVKMALSLSFTMNISGYERKADTSFDLLRSESITIGIYAACSEKNVAGKRPKVTVNGEPFIVLDLKDDNATDPTVKLILSAMQ